MRLLGLTGGVGMGKTTAAELLRQRGVAVVDTDILARQVVEPGQPALEEIRAAFGPSMISINGQLLREEMARRVFSDPDARRQLEAILHPRIRSIWQEQIEIWRAAGQPTGVVVIPLLFETQAEIHFDATVCVACSWATQRRRLQARGWSDAEIDRRLQAQWSIEKKMALADYVIWTEGNLEAHAQQWERILKD